MAPGDASVVFWPAHTFVSLWTNTGEITGDVPSHVRNNPDKTEEFLRAHATAHGLVLGEVTYTDMRNSKPASVYWT